jgi:hypothetical protein
MNSNALITIIHHNYTANDLLLFIFLKSSYACDQTNLIVDDTDILIKIYFIFQRLQTL